MGAVDVHEFRHLVSISVVLVLEDMGLESD